MKASVELIIEHLIFSPFVFLLGLILILFWPKAWKKKQNTKSKWLIGLWGIALLLTSTSFFQIFSWPLKENTPANNKQKADAIVVATAGIHESGAPSPGSTIRAHTAAQLYKEGLAPLILVTGGITQPYSSQVEAKGMRIILLGMGVPDTAILIENKSTDTYLNGVMSAKILEKREIKKVLLVTHDYHLLRLTLVFKKLGFDIYPYAANSATKRPEPWWRYLDWNNFNRLRTIAHEYIGLLAYKVMGYI